MHNSSIYIVVNYVVTQWLYGITVSPDVYYVCMFPKWPHIPTHVYHNM